MSEYENDASGDYDRFDVDFDDDGMDNIICPYCGGTAWAMEGEFVCDECGAVEED